MQRDPFYDQITAKIITHKIRNADGSETIFSVWEGGELCAFSDELMNEGIRISRDTMRFDCPPLQLEIVGHDEEHGCYLVRKVKHETN